MKTNEVYNLLCCKINKMNKRKRVPGVAPIFINKIYDFKMHGTSFNVHFVGGGGGGILFASQRKKATKWFFCRL